MLNFEEMMALRLILYLPRILSPDALLRKGGGHKIKTHACVTRAGYVDTVRKKTTVTPNWTIFITLDVRVCTLLPK
jgi:hypothetical protein